MATIGDLLTELRDIMDATDGLNSELRKYRERRDQIESEIRKMAEETGLDQFANDAITVSVKEELMPGYDPEQWNELVAWAVATGNIHMIQRRLSSRPILELIDNGTELPAGLRVEPVTKVSVRRK